VVFKLVMNLFATLVLLMYMRTLERFADIASSGGEVSALRDPSPLLHAVLALVLLLVATTLGVLKPRGLTPYGRRAYKVARGPSSP
jgi:hypothetical protein